MQNVCVCLLQVICTESRYSSYSWDSPSSAGLLHGACQTNTETQRYINCAVGTKPKPKPDHFSGYKLESELNISFSALKTNSYFPLALWHIRSRDTFHTGIPTGRKRKRERWVLILYLTELHLKKWKTVFLTALQKWRAEINLTNPRWMKPDSNPLTCVRANLLFCHWHCRQSTQTQTLMDLKSDIYVTNITADTQTSKIQTDLESSSDSSNMFIWRNMWDTHIMYTVTITLRQTIIMGRNYHNRSGTALQWRQVYWAGEIQVWDLRSVSVILCDFSRGARR